MTKIRKKYEKTNNSNARSKSKARPGSNIKSRRRSPHSPAHANKSSPPESRAGAPWWTDELVAVLEEEDEKRSNAMTLDLTNPRVRERYSRRMRSRTLQQLRKLSGTFPFQLINGKRWDRDWSEVSRSVECQLAFQEFLGEVKKPDFIWCSPGPGTFERPR